MPTQKQREALTNMVENGGNVGKAMTDAGYSSATAKTPQKLTESKGFQEILIDHGLTQELVVSALVEDINAKKGKRKAELELAAKLLGILKPSGVQMEVTTGFSLGKLHEAFEERQRLEGKLV